MSHDVRRDAQHHRVVERVASRGKINGSGIAGQQPPVRIERSCLDPAARNRQQESSVSAESVSSPAIVARRPWERMRAGA